MGCIGARIGSEHVAEFQKACRVPPGRARQAALVNVFVTTMTFEFALPAGVLALFGYGVFPNRLFWITGEPPVRVLWDEAQRKNGVARKKK